MNLRQAAQQALEALEYTGMDVGKFNRVNAACAALRAALAEPEQNPLGDEAERYARKLREEREVRNLADYEFKTYKTGGAELEAGFYSTDELRDLVKALDKMNAATERSMRRMK